VPKENEVLVRVHATTVTRSDCGYRGADPFFSRVFIGADAVVDYEREDFTKSGETYDVIFDAVGKHSFRRCRSSLRAGGVFITTDLGFMWHVPPLALLTRWIGDKRVTLPIPKYAKEDVLHVKELVEAGRYRPVIDRTYPLEDVVEATRYVETGQKTGNVVLTIAGGAT
jgi:NADPH:quinone reductase-like Zn-dependent oxidoreductase